MSYPSPCEKCEKDCGHICAAWEKRYRYRQKQINAWRVKALAVKVKPLPENKFCYSHPDDVRRWLKNRPCDECRVNRDCDRPCSAYLYWYDSRMKVARRMSYGNNG